MFRGRDLFIASMHKKENALAAILESELEVNIITKKDFNTDVFGTFSGEIERKTNPYDTLKLKCESAHKHSNCELILASEGSFGPHPNCFFLPLNEELLMLYDFKNKIEIVSKIISSDTNFASEEISDEFELLEFTKKVNFPSHGLILRENKNDKLNIVKGITDWKTLLKTFLTFQEKSKTVYVETDMRAHLNPTRMRQIQKCGIELIKKIKNYCPRCKTPGFDVSTIKKGLPCELCHSPTNSILSYIYSCKKCSYSSEKKFPNNKLTEDPMFCDSCNP
jgi:hypothetical protein